MPAHSKDPSVRQRRNKTTTRATLQERENPTIPALPAGTRWYPQVREWWDRAWSSPMSGEWTVSDVDAMYLAARLQQQFWNPRTKPALLKQLSGEIRLLMDRCGLTPMSRRTLQWELPPRDPESQPAEGRPRASKRASSKKADADPLDHLYVVK
jgi:hypothetical protein